MLFQGRGDALYGHFLPFCVTRHTCFDIPLTVSADQFWQYRLNKAPPIRSVPCLK